MPHRMELYEIRHWKPVSPARVLRRPHLAPATVLIIIPTTWPLVSSSLEPMKERVAYALLMAAVLDKDEEAVGQEHC
jgi:hypothetical protein